MNYLLSENECIRLVQSNPGAILDLLPAQRTTAVWASVIGTQSKAAAILPTHNPIRAGLLWEGYMAGEPPQSAMRVSSPEKPPGVHKKSYQHLC